MDPLSDVLSLLKPRSYASGGLTAGGRWAIQYPQHDGIKCYAVITGECWLALEGLADAIRVRTGDCLLLPHGRSFRLASDLTSLPVDARVLYSGAAYNGIVSCNPGKEFFLVGSHFLLDGNAGLLLDVLPSIVHLQKKSDKSSMRWSVMRMMQELRDPKLGSFLIVQQIAYTMLVQALRLHLTEGLRGGVGWLFALADKQIGKAIGIMHEDPARDWTLQELAGNIGMSRTTFAQKFKRTVGVPAMEYLKRWRMLLAGDRLLHSKDPISVIAQSLGYESESAFSAAFRRTMGCSPRQYSGARQQSARLSHQRTIAA